MSTLIVIGIIAVFFLVVFAGQEVWLHITHRRKWNRILRWHEQVTAAENERHRKAMEQIHRARDDTGTTP